MSSGNEFFDRVANRTGVQVLLDSLKYDQDGLVAVVSQDVDNNEVIGVAFADRVAIQKSLETGLMHFYSRSRKKLWLKGEESGHHQKVVELRVDCDGDALLARVHQVMGNCHLGFFSCFSYEVLKQPDGQWAVKQVGKKVFDPAKVYKKK